MTLEYLELMEEMEKTEQVTAEQTLHHQRENPVDVS